MMKAFIADRYGSKNGLRRKRTCKRLGRCQGEIKMGALLNEAPLYVKVGNGRQVRKWAGL